MEPGEREGKAEREVGRRKERFVRREFICA